MRLTASGFAAIISDDVQYYDPATVELGAFFLSQSFPMGEVGDVPRHIITYRSGTLPPLTAARIDALVNLGSAVRIELEPLGGASVAALLDDLQVPHRNTDLSRDLQALTSGNPQFLLEALRHMYQTGEFRVDEALPGWAGGVSSLVVGRLARLSTSALQAARGAADRRRASRPTSTTRSRSRRARGATAGVRERRAGWAVVAPVS